MQGLHLVLIILLAVVFLAALGYSFKGGARLRTALRQADLKITVYPFVIISLIAGFVSGLAVFLFSGSLTAAIITTAVVTAAPSIYPLDKRRRRFGALLSQLPDALELMVRSLQDGHSFVSALQVAATEASEPTAREFGKVYEEKSLRLNMKSALENLVERVPIFDLRLFVTAALIQREIGGNLSEALRSVSHTIRERSRVRGAIRIKSAQARWPGYVVSASPFFLFYSINLVTPSYMKTFYDHQLGVYALGVGAVMQAVGWMITREILNIQESPSFLFPRRASNRKRRISRALPDALDLMVVCVEAGLDLNAALQRVERQMEVVEAEMAEELAVANREIRAGKPRDLALRDLGVRAGVDDVISLAATLAHAEHLGTSIACSMRIFADSMRMRRHKRAERLVARATIKLIFPLLLCIFPALLIVLMGPEIAEISDLFRFTGR